MVVTGTIRLTFTFSPGQGKVPRPPFDPPGAEAAGRRLLKRLWDGTNFLPGQTLALIEAVSISAANDPAVLPPSALNPA